MTPRLPLGAATWPALASDQVQGGVTGLETPSKSNPDPAEPPKAMPPVPARAIWQATSVSRGLTGKTGRPAPDHGGHSRDNRAAGPTPLVVAS